MINWHGDGMVFCCRHGWEDNNNTNQQQQGFMTDMKKSIVHISLKTDSWERKCAMAVPDWMKRSPMTLDLFPNTFWPPPLSQVSFAEEGNDLDGCNGDGFLGNGVVPSIYVVNTRLYSWRDGIIHLFWSNRKLDVAEGKNLGWDFRTPPNANHWIHVDLTCILARWRLHSKPS